MSIPPMSSRKSWLHKLKGEKSRSSGNLNINSKHVFPPDASEMKWQENELKNEKIILSKLEEDTDFSTLYERAMNLEDSTSPIGKSNRNSFFARSTLGNISAIEKKPPLSSTNAEEATNLKETEGVQNKRYSSMQKLFHRKNSKERKSLYLEDMKLMDPDILDHVIGDISSLDQSDDSFGNQPGILKKQKSEFPAGFKEKRFSRRQFSHSTLRISPLVSKKQNTKDNLFEHEPSAISVNALFTEEKIRKLRVITKSKYEGDDDEEDEDEDTRTFSRSASDHIINSISKTLKTQPSPSTSLASPTTLSINRITKTIHDPIHVKADQPAHIDINNEQFDVSVNLNVDDPQNSLAEDDLFKNNSKENDKDLLEVDNENGLSSNSNVSFDNFITVSKNLSPRNSVHGKVPRKTSHDSLLERSPTPSRKTSTSTDPDEHPARTSRTYIKEQRRQFNGLLFTQQEQIREQLVRLIHDSACCKPTKDQRYSMRTSWAEVLKKRDESDIFPFQTVHHRLFSTFFAICPEAKVLFPSVLEESICVGGMIKCLIGDVEKPVETLDIDQSKKKKGRQHQKIHSIYGMTQTQAQVQAHTQIYAQSSPNSPLTTSCPVTKIEVTSSSTPASPTKIQRAGTNIELRSKNLLDMVDIKEISTGPELRKSRRKDPVISGSISVPCSGNSSPVGGCSPVPPRGTCSPSPTPQPLSPTVSLDSVSSNLSLGQALHSMNALAEERQLNNNKSKARASSPVNLTESIENKMPELGKKLARKGVTEDTYLAFSIGLISVLQERIPAMWFTEDLKLQNAWIYALAWALKILIRNGMGSRFGISELFRKNRGQKDKKEDKYDF